MALHAELKAEHTLSHIELSPKHTLSQTDVNVEQIVSQLVTNRYIAAIIAMIAITHGPPINAPAALKALVAVSTPLKAVVIVVIPDANFVAVPYSKANFNPFVTTAAIASLLSFMNVTTVCNTGISAGNICWAIGINACAKPNATCVASAFRMFICSHIS